jgi:hypothetical protein
LKTIYPVWPWNSILLFSASWVGRIHRCEPPVPGCFNYVLDRVLCFLHRAGLRLRSSYLCLPHSWDYRSSTTMLSPAFNFSKSYWFKS